MRIKITMKDGTVEEFAHQTRAGGSYTNRVRTEGAFMVVTDVWGREKWIPAEDIKHVETEEGR